MSLARVGRWEAHAVTRSVANIGAGPHTVTIQGNVSAGSEDPFSGRLQAHCSQRNVATGSKTAITRMGESWATQSAGWRSERLSDVARTSSLCAW
jgi:hypothetical protein